METKQCRKCGVTKPLEDFSRDKRSIGRLKSLCKKCEAKPRRKQRMESPPWELPAEQWRDIPGCEGYQASDMGRVRSVDRLDSLGRRRVGKVLSACKSKGYPFVLLRLNDESRPIRVHRLVAAAFLGECPEGYHVHHINGNKADNRPSNLAYMDGREHLRMHSTERDSGLTEADIPDIWALMGRGVLLKDIAAKYGVSISSISRIRHGNRWGHMTDGWEQPPKSMASRSGAKLSVGEVVVIKSLLGPGVMQKDLANAFGVSVSTVCNIGKEKAWAGVEPIAGFDADSPAGRLFLFINQLAPSDKRKAA